MFGFKQAISAHDARQYAHGIVGLSAPKSTASSNNNNNRRQNSLASLTAAAASTQQQQTVLPNGGDSSDTITIGSTVIRTVNVSARGNAQHSVANRARIVFEPKNSASTPIMPASSLVGGDNRLPASSGLDVPTTVKRDAATSAVANRAVHLAEQFRMAEKELKERMRKKKAAAAKSRSPNKSRKRRANRIMNGAEQAGDEQQVHSTDEECDVQQQKRFKKDRMPTKPGYEFCNVLASSNVCCIVGADQMGAWIIKRTLDLVYYGGPSFSEVNDRISAPSSLDYTSDDDAQWESGDVNANEEQKAQPPSQEADEEKSEEQLKREQEENRLQCLKDYIDALEQQERWEVSLGQLCADTQDSSQEWMQRYTGIFHLLRRYLSALVETHGNVYAQTLRQHLQLYTRDEYAERRRQFDEFIDEHRQKDTDAISLDQCIEYLGREQQGYFRDVYSVLDEVRKKRNRKQKLPLRQVYEHLCKFYPDLERQGLITMGTKGAANPNLRQQSVYSISIKMPEHDCSVAMYSSCSVHSRGAKSIDAARASVDEFVRVLNNALSGDAFYVDKFWVSNIMAGGHLAHRVRLEHYSYANNASYEPESFAGMKHHFRVPDTQDPSGFHEMTVNIQASGYVWIVRGKRPEHVRLAFEYVRQCAAGSKRDV